MSDVHETAGYTGALSTVVLVIGDGAKTGPALACPNGAGCDYAINGLSYHKADAATVLPLTADTVQAELTTCLYLIQIDSAGTVSSVQGVPVLTADLTAETTALQIPAPGADKCPIGLVKVATASGYTFTPGTTALDATGITETYYGLAGIPNRPFTS